jgi:hypothetical protein
MSWKFQSRQEMNETTVAMQEMVTSGTLAVPARCVILASTPN